MCCGCERWEGQEGGSHGVPYYRSETGACQERLSAAEEWQLIESGEQGSEDAAAAGLGGRVRVVEDGEDRRDEEVPRRLDEGCGERADCPVEEGYCFRAGAAPWRGGFGEGRGALGGGAEGDAGGGGQEAVGGGLGGGGGEERLEGVLEDAVPEDLRGGEEGGVGAEDPGCQGARCRRCPGVRRVGVGHHRDRELREKRRGPVWSAAERSLGHPERQRGHLLEEGQRRRRGDIVLFAGPLRRQYLGDRPQGRYQPGVQSGAVARRSVEGAQAREQLSGLSAISAQTPQRDAGNAPPYTPPPSEGPQGPGTARRRGPFCGVRPGYRSALGAVRVRCGGRGLRPGSAAAG